MHFIRPRLCPQFIFRGCFGYVLFEFIHNLVYFPSFKLGLDTARHYWILFLHFHNFWAPSSQFQVTDITFGWLLCLWRFHGLHHSLFDTKRRLYHGFSCHRRVSLLIKSNEFGPLLILAKMELNYLDLTLKNYHFCFWCHIWPSPSCIAFAISVWAIQCLDLAIL